MNELVTRAPARLDFGGGWTDVPPYSLERGGCVCNVAIELHAVVTVRAGDADASGAARTLDADNRLARAAARRCGMRDVRVSVDTEFPLGAGLGGSSAAGVARQPGARSSTRSRSAGSGARSASCRSLTST